MDNKKFPITTFFVIAFSLISLTSLGRTRKIAILPVSNFTQIKPIEIGFMFDVIRQTAIQNALDLPVYLLSKDLVTTAIEAASDGDPLDEISAASLGLSIGADLVIQSEIRRIERERRITVKLLDTKEGSLIGMEQARGQTLGELEIALEKAVQKLFAKIKGVVAAKTSATIPTSPHLAYYGELLVTAVGIKEGDETRKPHKVIAEVTINDKKVGHTPFMDGLPEGVYQVKVSYGETSEHIEEVKMTPGEAFEVIARLTLPLTRRERETLNKIETSDRNSPLNKTAEWQLEIANWKEMNAIALRKRKVLLGTAIPLVAAGVGLVIAGGVFIDSARQEQEKADDYQTTWELATDPLDIQRANDNLSAAENARDKDAVLGISLLSVGGAALVTGVVLFVFVPKIPEMPGHQGKKRVSDVRFVPLVSPHSVGSGFSLRF